MNRLQQLENWLKTIVPGEAFSLAPASSDASFRRYFRATFPQRSVQRTLIVMDAPPAHEDCRPFLAVARLFACVHVPQVLAQDLAQGFLLLEDLGDCTYLQVLNTDSAAALYRDATASLLAIQLASQPDVLPPYDAALLQKEMALYPEWYVARHKGRTLNEAQQSVWERSTALITARCLAQPKVYVHRDYHSRNLMLCAERNPGVIDFQDAVYGPATYDLVSLLKDAYIEWDEDFVLDIVIRYWEEARKAGLPLTADFGEFYRDFEWMGVQRHLKVLGIFARLYLRDGKDGYLQDLPLVLHYVRKACGRYIELKPLLRLIDDIEDQPVQVGYTF